MSRQGCMRWCSSIVLAVAALYPALTQAGEIKLGAEPLDVDDEGKLTAEGRADAIDELESEPGEELWTLHLWGKIDKGAPGPLYVEFTGKTPDGKTYVAYQYEHAEYDGESYVSFPIELDGNTGFNKDRTYTIKVTQVGKNKKDILLATGKVTLRYKEEAPEPEEDGEAEEGGSNEEADEMSKQDELDTLGGPDEDPESSPPPVDPRSNKGCSVVPAPYGVGSAFLFFVFGAGLTPRRPRRSRLASRS